MEVTARFSTVDFKIGERVDFLSHFFFLQLKTSEERYGQNTLDSRKTSKKNVNTTVETIEINSF